MAFQLFVLLAAVAVANAGFLAGGPAAVAYSAAPAVSHVSYASPLVSYGTPAITTQQQNVYRSPGNLAQVSTYSKTIDTPFSSVSKSDVRVTNPGYAVHAVAPAYAAPVAYHAAPAYAAPVAYHAAPAYAAPVVKSYAAAPALAYNAVPSYSYAAAAPVVTKSYAAAGPVLAAPAHGLLGVAYSAAPAVSHMSYSNGLGLTYGW